ncbi:MAG: TIGR00730 family Rossman fold protein [Stellaceae bacterium]
MASVKSLCVFCGASDAVGETYRGAATRLGAILAEARIELVFGGGRIGLMGLIASAVAAGGGKVTGIIPRHLHRAEIGDRPPLGELQVVATMHERKALMFDRADAFAVLPGGLGTLDETFEVLTWKQLGLHDKPVVLIDVAGYWAPLLKLIEAVIAAGFAPASSRTLFRTVAGPEELLPLLRSLPKPATKPAGRFPGEP